MGSVVIDYNTVQIAIWSILAIIAWLLRESMNKMNDHLSTVSNHLTSIQSTLNQIQISLGLSAVQIGRVEIKKSSEEEVAKKVDISKVIKLVDKIESEEREEEVELGDDG